MSSIAIKTGIKLGLITAGVIILFQTASLFLVYKYFRFDYYLTAIALIFLLIGFSISKWKSGRNDKNQDMGKLSGLTTKELNILQSIIAGKTNKEIAIKNFVEVSTVKTHINNMYAKLGVSNRREVIRSYKNKISNTTDV